jgi:aspartyl aminopeptidase
MKGFIAQEDVKAMPVLAVFDNEEVGSSTKQGAASTFLFDTLNRVVKALGGDENTYRKALAHSFMISADNAHAVHPNQPGISDPTNRPAINKGVVIKYNANQRYTTDAFSAAVFKGLLNDLDIPYQTFANRSDIMGGGTLGNISNTRVALNTVDIGLPQLAMHSAYETAGVKDTEDFIKICESFFGKKLNKVEDDKYTVE